MNRVDELIGELKLKPHPEGGFFKETYRSEGVFTNSGTDFPSGRSYSTGIYYLLNGNDRSAFHRIKSDELWHFYEGSSATIHIIHPDSLYEALYLGPDVVKGQQFQHVVPGGSWFGVSVDDTESYMLAGCTVAPGFDFNDFEMADPYKLKKAFPEQSEIIDRLT